MIGRRIVIPELLLPDPAKLELIVDHLDALDRQSGVKNREAQEEIEQWVATLRMYGVRDRYTRKDKA